MHDSELRQYVSYTRFLMDAVQGQLDDLISTIRSSSAGYPTGHEGKTELDDNGEAVTYDSRTESAALHQDPARDARRELERNVKALRNAAVNLDGLREKWLFTTHKTPVGKQSDPGCESCKRLRVTVGGQSVARWEPRRKISERVEHGETIVNYGDLCEWCQDWLDGEGDKPPMKVLEAHHEGKRITSALLAKLGIKTKAASARDRRKAS